MVRLGVQDCCESGTGTLGAADFECVDNHVDYSMTRCISLQPRSYGIKRKRELDQSQPMKSRRTVFKESSGMKRNSV